MFCTRSWTFAQDTVLNIYPPCLPLTPQALTIAIATGPFPLARNMWLPDHDSERYRLYL